MRVIFVRHGEPDYEKDCLTDAGRRQAEAAASRLAGEGISEIYTSPMGRAAQTARATADALGIREIHTLDFMHELTWGSVDGTPIFADGHPWDIADELIRQGWDLTDPDWPDHPLFRNNLVTASARHVERETDRWLAALGYAREGLYYRCTAETEQDRTVALFCHGGSSSAAIGRIYNLTFPYVCALLHMPFTGITIARFDRRPGSVCLPHLELGSDARHLEGLEP